MRSAAKRPMSASEQFKSAVTGEAFPTQGWRGGLERSRARWERGRAFLLEILVRGVEQSLVIVI